MRQELSQALRAFRANPAFTAPAVFMLAIGIAASTVMFSVVDAVLLRPLPYPDSDRLVWIWSIDTRRSLQQWTSFPDFLDWRTQTRTLEHLAGWGGYELTLTGAAGPERIRTVLVSGDFFQLIGVSPRLGSAGDSGDRRVLVSHALWQRRFGSDPALVGAGIMLSGTTYTVTGVMPPRFRFPLQSPADVWMIVRDDQFNPALRGRRDARLIEVMARLRPGVTIEQAQADMETVAANLRRAYPETNADIGIRVVPAIEQVAGGVAMALWVMFAAVGGVLVIACANVANLLLSRTAARQAELAIRAALGANRTRIVRQLLLEAVPLAVVAGTAGGVLAIWGVRLVASLITTDVPRSGEIRVDLPVIAFTAAVSLLSVLIAAVVPAWRAARGDAGMVLQGASANIATPATARRLPRALATVQVAIAMVLLIACALLVNSFARLASDDPGFDPSNVLTFRIDWPSVTYRAPQIAETFAVLQERLEALPGVQAASTGLQLPDRGAPMLDRDLPLVDVEGRQTPESRQLRVSRMRIQPHYFRALGTPLLKGRDFSAADRGGSAPVVIVNRSLVRALFGETDPIGRRLLVSGWTLGVRGAEIVGVAEDVKHRFLGADASPIVYLPLAQDPGGAYVVVKTAADPLAIVGEVRRVVRSIDPDQPIDDIQTLDARVAGSLAQDRFAAIVLTLFAAAALVLSVGGLYAVLAHAVAQRSREMGIRVSLGAGKRDIQQLVFRDGLTITGVGLGAGAAVGLVATQALERLLFGIAATDPLTIVLAALLLTVVAWGACWIPARRATRVDPLAALRSL